MIDDEDEPPVEYLVLELPGGTMTGAGLALLIDLLTSGDGRVLDLVFIQKQPGEPAGVVDAPHLGDALDPDLAVPAGTSTGLIGPSEVAVAGDRIDVAAWPRSWCSTRRRRAATSGSPAASSAGRRAQRAAAPIP